MSSVLSRRGLAYVLALALALAAIGGASAAKPARKISVRMTFSGAYKASVSLTHAQDVITYACIQWTLPGKPPRYAAVFGELFSAQPALVLKFDYDSSALGHARRITAPSLVGLLVDTGKMFWEADSRATVTVTLGADLRHGSFVARKLVTSPPTTRRLHVRGSWRCASVARRTA